MPPDSIYLTLKSSAIGLPNDELFAQLIASQLSGESALPVFLGLAEADFSTLLQRHFPEANLPIQPAESYLNHRVDERDDVLTLLLAHRAKRDDSEVWMAHILTTACLASNHLWQDLGLRSRDDLSQLMSQNFPALATKNVFDMKWKKFIYKQLCEQAGVNTCRAPTCEYCVDYLNCFGPEE
jgi:nitrogen fixation protein NifQ